MTASTAALKVPARGRRFRPRLAAAVAVLSVVALLALSYVGSNVWASVSQHRLDARFEEAAARWAAMDPIARTNVAFSPGDPVARVTIPSIGLDAVVVEGATPGLMRRAPGHLIGSATPGDDGVAIITANRFGFGSFFLRLDRLDVGDTIIAQSPLGTTTYTVQEVRVVPVEQLDLSTDSTARQLMLFGGNRLWGGSDRLVVRAQVGEVRP